MYNHIISYNLSDLKNIFWEVTKKYINHAREINKKRRSLDMRCIYCNAELPEGARFCGKCGESLEKAQTYAQVGRMVEYNTYDEYPEEVKEVFKQYERSTLSKVGDWVAGIMAIVFLIVEIVVAATM